MWYFVFSRKGLWMLRLWKKRRIRLRCEYSDSQLRIELIKLVAINYLS